MVMFILIQVECDVNIFVRIMHFLMLGLILIGGFLGGGGCGRRVGGRRWSSGVFRPEGEQGVLEY